jgi:hypothetical protein
MCVSLFVRTACPVHLIAFDLIVLIIYMLKRTNYEAPEEFCLLGYNAV